MHSKFKIHVNHLIVSCAVWVPLVLLSGCGTLATTIGRSAYRPEQNLPSGPYAGVRFDYQGFVEYWHREPAGVHASEPVRKSFLVLRFVLDVPLCAIADTLLLPFDFIHWAFGPGDSGPESAEPEVEVAS